VITLPAEQTFGLELRLAREWSAAARERLQRLPAFARGMVARGVERYAEEHGIPVITPEVMQAVRAAAEARFGRAFRFAEFPRTSPTPPDPPPRPEAAGGPGALDRGTAEPV
jgi:hypothetical protein